jgi:hypothetical protein
MSCVIKIIELVGVANPLSSPDSMRPGEFLCSFDPDAYGGIGRAESTPDVEQALKFADAKDAYECWRKQSTVRPLRDDGKPNRPLTAYTVEIQQLEL